eukprot:Gb_16368 [translate_table: standard]
MLCSCSSPCVAVYSLSTIVTSASPPRSPSLELPPVVRRWLSSNHPTHTNVNHPVARHRRCHTTPHHNRNDIGCAEATKRRWKNTSIMLDSNVNRIKHLQQCYTWQVKPTPGQHGYAKYYNSIKEEDPPNEETGKELNEDNDEDFNSDDYEDCHKEEDCIQDEQLDEGYENYDEDPDEDSNEECDLECEDNGYDGDAEEYQDNIVELKGKDDDSNIPAPDQPEKPEEHKDGEGDHIMHVGNSDNGEMDHEENFCDEEDYDPDSYDKPEDTIDEDVWDPFPIVPQTQYSDYDDLAEEDVDKNGDYNEDYEVLDKNPNKEEDPEHEDRQLDQEYEGHEEGDDSKYKELDEELDIGDDASFSIDDEDEADKILVLVEDNATYEETSHKRRGNGPDQQSKGLGSDNNTKDDSTTSTKDLLPLLMEYTSFPPQEVINGTISQRFGKGKT